MKESLNSQFAAEVVRLRDEEGLTFREIEERLGISGKYAHTIYHRATHSTPARPVSRSTDRIASVRQVGNLNGRVWLPRPYAPRTGGGSYTRLSFCNKCPMLSLCKQALARLDGSFVACERILWPKDGHEIP